MRIFISSTFVDLRKDRDAAAEALRRSELVPWGMELFVSEPSTPLEVCLRDLRLSDAVVLIIGFYAGSLIPENPGLTYTGAEFQLAQQLGRPVFAFFKTEDGKPVNKETDVARQKALDDFKSAVKSANTTPAYFDSPERLQVELILAMQRWNSQGRPGSRLVFSTPTEFFARFQSGPPRLFDFNQTLRGRDAQLKALDEFVANPLVLVGVLAGRGGIGKSKLLHDWVRTMKNRTVLYVKEEAEWHGEAAKEIPAGDVLIVVDDAHKFDFLDRLALVVRSLNQRQNVKILLATRPNGIGQIDAILSPRFDAAQVSRFPQLERVPAQNVRELAVEVLGASHTQYAHALAAASADTPLVTVVGGRLIARGDIPPALLANEQDFRHEVLNRFSSEYELLLPAGSVQWRSLLNLVAALGPVSPSAPQFVDPAAQILGIRPDEVRSALDLLEQRGLLLRGGRIIRIVPDLLSDFLLEGACLTGAGESTGFSDLIFHTFQSTYLSNVLRNLGELDWRIAQRNPEQGARLLDHIWAEIEAAFEGGDASARRELCKSLKEVALFQPARVLRLIRHALENKAATVAVWADWEVTQEHVLREIPPLLRAISYHLDHIEEAAGILWRLAKSDNRAPNQYPDHARRVLQEMAEYGRYKPVRFNDWMADFAAGLSRDPREFAGSFTPLDLVDKLLEKEGEFTESEGFTISFGGFSLNYPAVKPVRGKALGIIERCLNSEDPKIALRTTKSVARVLSGFLPLVGRVLSEDEAKWQMEERFAVLDVVERRLKNTTPTPLLRQIRSVLRHARPHTREMPLGKRINELLAMIPQSADLLIFDAFSTGRWDLDGFHDDLAEADRSRRQLITRAIAAFREKFPDGGRQVAGLIELVKDAEDCGVDLGSNPYDFIEELCSEDFVRAFWPYAMNDPHRLLGYMTIVAIRWIRSSDRAWYREAGIEAATHKNQILGLAAADSLASGPNLGVPLPEDVAILQILARHSSPAVRRLTFTAIRRLGEHAEYESEAIEMLLVSEIGDDSGLAEEMCGAVDYYGIKKDNLSEAQVQALLNKLTLTKEIDGHHTERFLSWAGEHFPAALFDLILRRLDRDADFDRRDEKKGGYAPIPHHRFGHAFRVLQNGPRYREFLEQVRDRFTTQPEQGFWLHELFWSIGSIDGTALGVIDELLHRGDAESARIALQLLGGAPPELAITRPCFAVHVIEEASHVDASLGVSAESILITNCQTGPFQRAPGHPSGKYSSMKERSEALRELFPRGSTGHRLFTRLRDVAVEMLKRERLDDEQIDFE